MYTYSAYTSPRKTRDTYRVGIHLKGKVVAGLSCFDSLEHAQQEGQRIVNELNTGKITVEELIEQRKEQNGTHFMGLSQKEWAEKLGVTRNAIYKGATRNNMTWQEWVVGKSAVGKRLHLVKHLPK